MTRRVLKPGVAGRIANAFCPTGSGGGRDNSCGGEGGSAAGAGKLTSKQWKSIYALPADGNSYDIDGGTFQAAHYPGTRIQVESVIAETQFGTLRRRLIRGNWQPVERVEGIQRNA